MRRTRRPRPSYSPLAVLDCGFPGVHSSDNDFIAKALAEGGIVVASIDFRMPPEASYPASLADINLAVRWLKARAAQYHSRPDWVGSFGTSSGGHQVLLAAMRPDDPRYAALPLNEAPGINAGLAFVISGWGVLDPLLRYELAKKAGNAELLENHHNFWGDEAAKVSRADRPDRADPRVRHLGARAG